MDPKIKLVHDFLLALRNQKHDQMFSLLSKNIHIVGASGKHYGKPELVQYFSQSGNPYKDVKQELIGEYIMNDTVIIEPVLKAKHVGPYMGKPPSNKPIEMPILHVFKVKNGMITAWRQYQNFKILEDLHSK